MLEGMNCLGNVILLLKIVRIFLLVSNILIGVEYLDQSLLEFLGMSLLLTHSSLRVTDSTIDI